MQKPKKPRLIKSRIRKLAQVPVVKTEVSKSHVPKIKRNKENGQEKVCIKQSHEITILTLPESNSKSQKPLKINEINLLLGAILATFQNFKESIKAIIHSWVVATQISFIFIPKPWGNDPIWRAYFSNELVKPPTRFYRGFLVSKICWKESHKLTIYFITIWAMKNLRPGCV